MAKDFSTMEDSNPSSNPSIHDVSDPARRIVVRGSLGALAAGLLSPLVSGCVAPTGPGQVPSFPPGPLLGFQGISASAADGIRVPEGYEASVICKWGEPVGMPGNMPAFKADASNTAAEQSAQIGMHHDGMHFFPLEGNRRGLLAINHEYTDDGLLHADGFKVMTAEKVAKSIAAHGVSIVEVAQKADGAWDMVRPSKFARRITTATPMQITGPAAGHAMMRTAADPTGTQVLGTLNNCAAGPSAWNTFLTSEENFAFYFNGPDKPDAHQARWGLRKNGRNYRWHDHEARFDAVRHPNEMNRFGWIVEIDPTDPTSTPIKHTALGRGAHEIATVAVMKDNRVTVYMGEDAQFEYITKFVTRDAIKPGGFKANRELLDHGTLYVARFDADGTGRWIELTAGRNGLTPAAGFADQGELLVKTRQACDLVGGTKMDRPEWIAVDPKSGEVYCTLTNNSNRGGKDRPGIDAANPRANNVMGNIIRWKENGDFDAQTFTWNHFLLAGDPVNERPEARGNIKGDILGCPDGLWFDARGLLWVQTDIFATQMNKGEFARIGNNGMFGADPVTGEVRRFLTGPTNCEITGIATTPDLRTMFINVQHPGESPGERSDPARPNQYSNWPDAGVRPRSATVVIRRKDGGIIGT
jgi:secreted PhoX family phosphatase